MSALVRSYRWQYLPYRPCPHALIARLLRMNAQATSAAVQAEGVLAAKGQAATGCCSRSPHASQGLQSCLTQSLREADARSHSCHSKNDEASRVAWIALHVPKVEPRPIFARCVAPTLAGNPIGAHLERRARVQEGAITMRARAARGRTKRHPSASHPSASRRPIRGGAAKLARRLAEVQALRKLVQKAEAARL
jgi:hypothetical protein